MTVLGKELVVRLLAGLLTLSMPAATSASATLLVNGSGQLVGANGVNVGGTLYNVAFEECEFGISPSCNPFFTTDAAAQLAAQALLDQVLIDGAAGQFDSDPTKIFGCSNVAFCFVAVPYTLLNDTEAAFNSPTNAADSVTYTPFYWNGTTHGSGQLDYAVFARFSAVPELSTWAMMLLGFAGIGLATRRRAQPNLQFA